MHFCTLIQLFFYTFVQIYLYICCYALWFIILCGPPQSKSCSLAQILTLFRLQMRGNICTWLHLHKRRGNSGWKHFDKVRTCMILSLISWICIHYLWICDAMSLTVVQQKGVHMLPFHHPGFYDKRWTCCKKVNLEDEGCTPTGSLLPSAFKGILSALA